MVYYIAAESSKVAHRVNTGNGGFPIATNRASLCLLRIVAAYAFDRCYQVIHRRELFSYFFTQTTRPGRPSMDILVRSWQDHAKILETS